MIIQDEYREIYLTHFQIKNLGFKIIISSLSQNNLPKVYPKKKFSDVTFVSALPGYITDGMKRIKSIALNDKKGSYIFGRGRPHPFAFGSGKLIKDKIYFDYKYKFPKDASHSVAEISRLTGYKISGLRTIVKKGQGAFRSNPQSVRPQVKSATQWGIARLYSAVMGGQAQKIDKSHLIKK